MAAQCAVCMEPVEKGEKFVLQRTEVVHNRCLGGQTLTAKIKLAMIQAKVRIDSIEREARELRMLNESIAATKCRREDDLHKEIADLRRDLRLHLSVEAQLRQERSRARTERDEAVAARDTAVHELALRQTLEQARVTAPTPSKPEGTDVADDRDPTEVRFSLLELDPS